MRNYDKFIEVHELGTDIPWLINLDVVEQITVDDEGDTIIYFINWYPENEQDYMIVTESYNELKERIWG